MLPVVSEISSVNIGDIRKFIIDVSPEHRGSMDYVVLALRKFHSFLREHYLLEIKYEAALFVPRVRDRRVLPCINQNEIDQVLEQIDVSSAMGKRDYAIIVLGAYTGLRAGDIARLKLKDMDWTNNEILHYSRENSYPVSASSYSISRECISRLYTGRQTFVRFPLYISAGIGPLSGIS